MSSHIKSAFLSIGLTLLIFYFAAILTPVLWLAVGLTINSACFVGTIVLTFLGSYFINKAVFSEFSIKNFLINNGIAVAVIAVCAFVALSFYDISFDGQTYHLTSIMTLVNGWNPFWESSSLVEPVTWTTIHYPKTSWYSSSNIVAFFGDMRIGKLYNLLLIFATFFITTPVIIDTLKVKTALAVLMAFSLSLNIISINQIFCNYLDGQVANLFIIYIAVAILYFQTKQVKLYFPILLGISIALVNLKFPPAVFAVILGGAFLLFDWYYKGRKHFIKMSLITVVAFLIGGFFVGYSPYFVNTFQHGHPFYPLNETNLLDPGNLPNNFYEANRFYKLFHSLFSYQGQIIGIENTELKPPFSQGLMNTYGLPDTRIGAFGPFSALIFIISILSLIPFFFIKENQKLKRFLSIISAVILVTVFVHPEAWWGRYVPQLFLLPFFVMILFSLSKVKPMRIFGWLFFGLILFNQANVITSYLKNNIHSTKKIKEQLADMSKEKVLIYLSDFPTLAHRLDANDIDYTLVERKEELPCETPIKFLSCPSFVSFCVSEK